MKKVINCLSLLSIPLILSACSVPYNCPLNGGDRTDGFRCKSMTQTYNQMNKTDKSFEGETIWDDSEPIIDGEVVHVSDMSPEQRNEYLAQRGAAKLGVSVKTYKQMMANRAKAQGLSGTNYSVEGVDLNGSNTESLLDFMSDRPYNSTVGKPVYKQGEVYRVYLPAWVDADGVLHDGEYAFFSTPPSWSYGNMKQAGVGSDVLGPAKGDDLGFKAVIKQDSNKPDDKSVTKQNNTVINNPEVKAAQEKTESAVREEKDKTTKVDKIETKEGITQPYQKIGIDIGSEK